jgi:hypothetical protein
MELGSDVNNANQNHTDSTPLLLAVQIRVEMMRYYYYN